MREIKFRAWDKKEKLMLLNIRCRSLDGIEWMQFTGLITKGKEIYEGDIVTDGKENGVVVWQEHRAQFVIDWSISDKYCQPNDDWDLFEVVGNIYENPELLEK